MKEQFGFKFWLGWILQFAGSFLLASVFWTGALMALFGKIQRAEIVISWSVAVFGSWFILLTPFMRKKEQIWKRLNVDEEKAVDAWLSGLGFFIGLLVLSLVFWSWMFRAEILSSGARSLHPAWLKAVLASWLALALPFLAVLYRRADKIFKDAGIRQNAPDAPFQTAFVERQKRLLPSGVCEKIAAIPATLQSGHVVNLTLRDGRKIQNIFVLNASEILGVYDKDELGFEAREVVDAEPVAPLPVYEEKKWLRLDGRA